MTISERLQYFGRKSVVLLIVFFTVLISAFSASCEGSRYEGFKQLITQDCKPVENKAFLQLPTQWEKYAKFARICELKGREGGPARISIISIWVNTYFEETFPRGPHVWEQFPLPLIVDDSLKRVGELPEMYPMDEITSPQVYYGEWKGGIPGEIIVDVSNPADGGDYYYKPLLWNEALYIYESIDAEIVDGRRPQP